MSAIKDMEESGTWIDKPCFYVSVIDGPKFGLLLGPFREESECRKWAYLDTQSGGDRDKYCRLVNQAGECDPWAGFYSYGMVKMTNGHREGVLNRFFPETRGLTVKKA